MKDFLKKFCPTAAKVLSVPLLLYCIFCCITELFGFDRVDGYLSSLQIPFNSKQILTVGGIVFLLWLTCYCVMAWFKSKEIRASAEAEAKEHAASLDPGQTDTPLRTAARDVKCRILLEYTVGVYHICYRRVKKTNELVVNGMVYDEMTATMEPPHELTAVVDGHAIRAGLGEVTHSYIIFDGVTVARKARWI